MGGYFSYETYQPNKSKNVEQLTTNHNEQQLTTNHNEQQLTTNHNEQQLTTNHNEQQLTTNHNEQQLTTNHNEQQLTTNHNEQQLTTNHNEQTRPYHDKIMNHIETKIKNVLDLRDDVPTLLLTDTINKKTSDKHIGFFGSTRSVIGSSRITDNTPTFLTPVGKTTLINALFNKNYPVGLGRLTNRCELIHNHNENIIWDVCGINDDFQRLKPDDLAFVKSLDKCIVLFDKDISTVANIILAINAINPESLVVVRTKSDQYSYYGNEDILNDTILDHRKIEDRFRSSHINTIFQQKKIDQAKLEYLINKKVKIYCVSSHNVLYKKDKIYDWIQFKKILCLDT